MLWHGNEILARHGDQVAYRLVIIIIIIIIIILNCALRPQQHKLELCVTCACVCSVNDGQ